MEESAGHARPTRPEALSPLGHRRQEAKEVKGDGRWCAEEICHSSSRTPCAVGQRTLLPPGDSHEEQDALEGEGVSGGGGHEGL